MGTRDRIWFNLADKKFKALYMALHSRRAGTIRRWTSIFLALTSASCVAAWAIWQKLPWLWAAIVGVAQVMQVVKEYLPAMKHERDYLQMSFAYDGLYLEYEKLWFRLEDGKIDRDGAEQEFYVLREKENDLRKMYGAVAAADINRLIQKARRDVDAELKINLA